MSTKALSFPPTLVDAPLIRPGDVLPLVGGAVVDAVLVTSTRVHLAFREPVVSPFTKRKTDGLGLLKTDKVYVSRETT